MATHPAPCQVTAQPFGSFGEERAPKGGDVMRCSLHPGDAPFSLLTVALGELGIGVRGLGNEDSGSCPSCLFGPQ